MHVISRLAVLGVALVVLGGSAQAQEATGTVTGAVIDSNRAPLRGATVAIRHSSRANDNLSTETDKQGHFRFEGVPVGKGYAVRAQLAGFKAAVEEGVNVVEGKTTDVTLALPPASLRGLVVSRDGAPVMIDLGSKDGVTPGMTFRVYRARENRDYLDGIAVIEAGNPSVDACRCRLSGMDQDERPREGDTVIQITEGHPPQRIRK
jgi:hypothetical protein